jgi:L-lactate dehydrogenase
MPVSSLDDCNDIYSGFPAIIGRRGIIRRLEIQMTEQEGIKMQQSANALKQTLAQVKEGK